MLKVSCLQHSLPLRRSSTYHILGETLAQSNVMTLLDKVPRSKSITIGIPTSETLVRHIEKGKVLLLLDHIADLAPLLLGRVDTGRVMRTRMEHDDTVLRSSLDIGHETLKVQANGVLVVVTVRLDLETGILENGTVVGPAGRGDIDFLGVGIETGEECTGNSQSSRARDGLGYDETAIVDGWRVGAIREFCGGFGECRKTRDARVFFVEALRDNLVLSSANRW